MFDRHNWVQRGSRPVGNYWKTFYFITVQRGQAENLDTESPHRHWVCNRWTWKVVLFENIKNHQSQLLWPTVGTLDGFWLPGDLANENMLGFQTYI